MNATAASMTVVQTPAQRLRWPVIWTLFVAGLILWGMHGHLERFITPQRGLGYSLGIMGGSMMLLLLLYSARKRVSWLRWLGSIPAWFEFHMVLGIVGPLLVLFHANFHLGASNSNVALITMLLVSGSGLVGRYIYTRLHANMDGHQDTLEHLKAVGERLRSQTNTIAFLPGVMDYIADLERRFVQPPTSNVAQVLHLFTGAIRVTIARYLVRLAIHRAIDAATSAAAQSPRRSGSTALLARHAHKLTSTAVRYADRRLEAGRRMLEYRMYAKLFSFWHVLHIPLFFLLLLAGIAHVIAVSVY